MGSPALELAGETIDVIGVPGITASLAAAALLGAPLGHDHALISLSDLHTPWEAIERRIAAVAEADLVACFYDPASRERSWQLRKALSILAACRPREPGGLGADASRPGEAVGTSTLAAFDPARVDMRTLVSWLFRSRMMAAGWSPPRLPLGAVMTAVAVVTGRCQGCGACLLTCPERAIRPAGAASAAHRARAAKPAMATEAIGPTRRPARLIVLEESCTGCGESSRSVPSTRSASPASLRKTGRKHDPIRSRAQRAGPDRGRVLPDSPLPDRPGPPAAADPRGDERVIHASADFDYGTDLICDESALAAGVAAITRGAPVVTDVGMVAAGITGYPVICKIGDSIAARLARTVGITVSAAATRLAFGEAGPGAVWVVGCAPTALEEILRRDIVPALVIGLPVGFVGAAAAKEALRASGLPAISNVSEKGGSAVAAAAFNALLRIAHKPAPQTAPGGQSGRQATSGRPVLPERAVVRPPGAQAGPATSGRPRRAGRPRRRRPMRPTRRAAWPGTVPGIRRGGRFRRAGQAAHRPGGRTPAAEQIDVAGSFIELSAPALRDAASELVDRGHRTLVAVPLMLSAAGHSKGDVPAALARETARHPASPSGTAGRSARIRSC